VGITRSPGLKKTGTGEKLVVQEVHVQNVSISKPITEVHVQNVLTSKPITGPTTVPVQKIRADKLTALTSILFHVTNSIHPLASCGAVCRAGNRVVLDLEDEEGSYMENRVTKEKMRLRLSDQNTFCFDVEYPDGTEGSITLDSGAGASVWPKSLLAGIPMLPKAKGLRLIAANGSEIRNYGRADIRFRGISAASSPEDFLRLP
jgi:hypothetical protein